jgi:hypothetical protein
MNVETEKTALQVEQTLGHNSTIDGRWSPTLLSNVALRQHAMQVQIAILHLTDFRQTEIVLLWKY